MRPDTQIGGIGWLIGIAGGIYSIYLLYLGLPVTMPKLPLAELLAAMQNDKKRTLRQVRWVLTPRIGDASVPRAVESQLVRAALVLAGARTKRAWRD